MHTRRLVRIVLAVGASLIIAGCGGGSGSTSAQSTTTSTSSGASTANGRAALQACLKKKGISLPNGFGGGNGGSPPTGTPGSFPSGGTPGSLPGGADQAKIQAAIQACGGGTAGFPGGGAANTQAFASYFSCLSDHGVKVPTSTSGAQAGPAALNSVRSDPKFAAANKTCQALLPTPTAGSTTTTSG